MRYFTILIFTTLWVLNSYAQNQVPHWVSLPFPNILLRYYTGKYIILIKNMASGGNTRLYINERNATPSIPAKEPETASL